MSLTQQLWFEKNEYLFVKMPSPLDFTCQNLSLWLLMLLLLRKPSQVVAVFSTTWLTALGLEVGQVRSPLLPGHQTMASATRVLLIAVTCCAVPSIPCSFKKGLIVPYSLSTTLYTYRWSFQCPGLSGRWLNWKAIQWFSILPQLQLWS